jgi:cell pole-organizing protein PopZ
MNAKPKRPAVLDLGNFLVKSAPAAEAAPSSAPAIDAAPESSKAAVVVAPDSFRTSVYFSRAVHDKLREIAFGERKTITDLINEGLDHVLTSRHYATTAELRGKKH